MKPLNHSIIARNISSKCLADSTLAKSSRWRRTSTLTSSRNHLRPQKEPQATMSQYKQAISHQRRRARRRNRQQGWGHSPLLSIPSLRKRSTSTLPPLTTKPSSCAGITASAPWPSPSSSNLHLTARSLDDWPRSSLLPACDAFLVPLPRSPGKDQRPPPKCLWQQRQDNVLVLIK